MEPFSSVVPCELARSHGQLRLILRPVLHSTLTESKSQNEAKATFESSQVCAIESNKLETDVSAKLHRLHGQSACSTPCGFPANVFSLLRTDGTMQGSRTTRIKSKAEASPLYSLRCFIL